MVSKLSNRLKRELQGHRSKDTSPEPTLFEIVVVIFLLFIGINEVFDFTFIFFYTNYIVYTFLGTIIVSIILLKIPKILYKKRFTRWYYESTIILICILGIWTIPKMAHKVYFNKKNICFESQLISKRFMNKIGNGVIKFKVLNTIKMPTSLLSFDAFYGVPEEQYNNLPKKGEKIRICGEISKIGFSFDTVEAVRDENVSIEP